MPVERISWYDAVEFCARLTEYTELPYRLPSEAEWEYACRAGTTTPFYFGETISPKFVNYDGNYTYGEGPKGEYRQKTTPVGSLKIADAFGLSDMHGNVWEWCSDLCHDNYNGAPADGSAWEDLDKNHLINLRQKPMIMIIIIGSCAVVRGADIGGTGRSPFATGIYRRTATTTSVFRVVCVSTRG